MSCKRESVIDFYCAGIVAVDRGKTSSLNLKTGILESHTNVCIAVVQMSLHSTIYKCTEDDNV